MANFWIAVKHVIKDSDIVLEVVDARHFKETRHEEIEEMTLDSGKSLIIVITKCDLVSKDELEGYKKSLDDAVFVSAKEFYGIKMLKERILTIAQQKKIDKPTVGVLGYPNVGKSSLINVLKGTDSARVSSMPGMTKGKQKFNARQYFLLDTPGVIPYLEKDENKHAMIGAKNVSKVNDPEGVVGELMAAKPGVLQKYYGIESDDPEVFIERYAFKRGFLLKGGEPDVDRAARTILLEWQKGKIKVS